MADERSVNGDIYDVNAVEITGGEDASKFSGLTEKIEYLEHENGKIVGENKGYKQKIEELKVIIHDLSTDNGYLKLSLQDLESDTKGLKEMAARTADLEAECSRLQHDLHESTTETSDLKNEFEIVSKREKEKDAKLEGIQNERDILSSRVTELVASETSLRDVIKGKEKDIKTLKKSIVELQGSLESNKILEKMNIELEMTIENLKEDISTLQRNLIEKEKSINGNDDDQKGNRKNWFLVGGSTVAAIAVMGMACYSHSAKKHH